MAKKDWESAQAVLPPSHRRLPPERAPARRADRARRQLLRGGGRRELRARRLLLPRVPHSLPAAPQVRLRPVPCRRVVLQADELARPRPDGHRIRPSRSTSGSSTSTRSPPGWSPPARRSASAARRWRARTSRSATSTRRRASPGAPPSAATRRSSRSIPTTRGSTRSSSGCPSAWRFSGRYAEARPQLARLQAEFPQSAFVEEAKKLEATFPPAGVPAPPRLPPPGRPRRASRPAHPRAVRRRGATDLKCHFEDVRKDLLTTSLFS